MNSILCLILLSSLLTATVFGHGRRRHFVRRRHGSMWSRFRPPTNLVYYRPPTTTLSIPNFSQCNIGSGYSTTGLRTCQTLSSYDQFYSFRPATCCTSGLYGSSCCAYIVISGFIQYKVCKCSPDVTCGLPTTTTSTTASTTTSTSTTTTTTSTTPAPTTTAPFQSLCADSFRLLNGEPVADECTYKGVARAIVVNPALPNEPVTCNLVYTQATVNGVVTETFLTHQYCKQLFEAVISGGGDVSVDIEFGTQRLPISADLFDFADGPDGTAFVTIKDRFATILSDVGPCQTSACGFIPTTMVNEVDFNDCKMVSFGSTAIDATQTGLNEAAVQLDAAACSELSDPFGTGNALCFASVSGLPLPCSGDHGAPVYCRAPSNGELILVGVAAFQPSCGASTASLVVPFPS